MSNSIVKFTVSIPGSTPLSAHGTEDEARQACQRANRICCPGHKVFAEHEDGTVSGPY